MYSVRRWTDPCPWAPQHASTARGWKNGDATSCSMSVSDVWFHAGQINFLSPQSQQASTPWQRPYCRPPHLLSKLSPRQLPSARPRPDIFTHLVARVRSLPGVPRDLEPLFPVPSSATNNDADLPSLPSSRHSSITTSKRHTRGPKGWSRWDSDRTASAVSGPPRVGNNTGASWWRMTSNIYKAEFKYLQTRIDQYVQHKPSRSLGGTLCLPTCKKRSHFFYPTPSHLAGDAYKLRATRLLRFLQDLAAVDSAAEEEATTEDDVVEAATATS